MARLAEAIEAIAESDRKLMLDNTEVDRLRCRGAVDLYCICRAFVDGVNGRLAEPVLLIDPQSFEERNYNDRGENLFQINLRGRILQFGFGATGQLYEDDDFPRPYVLRGAVRSFNQDPLNHSSVDEQMIFYCPEAAGGRAANGNASWYFFDERSHRSGKVEEDYLISEMERLL